MRRSKLPRVRSDGQMLRRHTSRLRLVDVPQAPSRTAASPSVRAGGRSAAITAMPMVTAAARRMLAAVRNQRVGGGGTLPLGDEGGSRPRQRQWNQGRMPPKKKEREADYHGHNTAALHMRVDSMINVDRPAWGAARKKKKGRGRGTKS